MKLPEHRRPPMAPTAHELEVGRIITEARAERERSSREAAVERERQAWKRIEAEERAEQEQRQWAQQFEGGEQ